MIDSSTAARAGLDRGLESSGMAERAVSASLDELVAELAGRRLAVITGAGLSTGSGIGAYRDEAGAWMRKPPVQMQAFVADTAMRRRYWARSMLGWPQMARARPNPGHRALAELEGSGWLAGLITQNVDGLHQAAGHREVIDLHGRLAEVICLSCGHRSGRASLQDWLEATNGWLVSVGAAAAPDGDADLDERFDLADFRVPECARCGGMVKPDVVFYGDSVPRARVDAAYERVDAADAVLVVGSSLMVFSSFRFCRHAHARGIPIHAINRGVTRADSLLGLKIEADCRTALVELARRLDAVARPGSAEHQFGNGPEFL